MNNKHLLLVIFVAVVSLFIFWLPFVLRAEMWGGIRFSGASLERIVQNFDGLNFLVVSRTWYDSQEIALNFGEILQSRRPLYFAAHYPGYPLLIAFFDLFVSGPRALLLSIVTSNVLLAIALYYFFDTVIKNKKMALLLSLVALFFPARMLAARAVGSNEPLFMFFALMSIAYSLKVKHILSGLMGAAAILTRSPGILLFMGYFMYYVWGYRHNLKKAVTTIIPYTLIPLVLLGLFVFYGYRFGSFWTYFQVGGNINLYYPFAVFGSGWDWVSGMWLEDIVYLFALIAMGAAGYYSAHGWTPATSYLAIYGFFIVCVAHRDLARYSLPITPLLIAGMADYLRQSRLVMIFLIVLILPTFLYAWQFVLANYQPITLWEPFL